MFFAKVIVPTLAIALMLTSCAIEQGSRESDAVSTLLPKLDAKQRSDRKEMQSKCDGPHPEIDAIYRKCVQKLAEKGNAHAMWRLAYMYQWQQADVQQDPEIAASWYLKAAELGHVDAQRKTATNYLLGGSEEYIRDMREYQRSTGTENEFSEIGWRAVDGGVTKDLEKSMYWDLKAAAQGYVPAEESIAAKYKEGLGVPINYGTAIEWFTKAAMKGDGLAMLRLAELYQEGKGSPIDHVKWYAWMNTMQGFSGNENGGQNLDIEATRLGMTSSQIAEAQRISSQLFVIIKRNKTAYCKEFFFDNFNCPWTPTEENL